MPEVETTLPVLAVEPGHIAEARRALRAQGKDAGDDDAVARLLWAARALPAALDALSDVRSDIGIAQARFTAVRVELPEPARRPGPRDALLSRARTTAAGVDVDVVELFPYLDTGDATVRCRVRFQITPEPESATVQVVRFQVP